MTRKHFEAIAEAIKNTPFITESDRNLIATRIADDVCAKANPRFNRRIFLAACGVRAKEATTIRPTGFAGSGTAIIHSS